VIYIFLQWRRRNRGDLPPQNLPVELGQDLAELGPDRPHELEPGMVGIKTGGMYGVGAGGGRDETRALGVEGLEVRLSELAA